jgi:gas vesicle protein
MSDQKKSKFGLGVLFGTLIGGLTAFFFSPRSGKENREAVAKKIKELKKILKEEKVDEKIKEVYVKAKEWLIEELAQLKEAVESIDYEKYEKAVDKVIVRVKKETKKGAKEIEKLKKQLLKEWKKLNST